jgi:hypothetical protein
LKEAWGRRPARSLHLGAAMRCYRCKVADAITTATCSFPAIISMMG